MGGRGIQVWERVIGGWVVDICVEGCDWWVDGGYMCESVGLVGGRGIHV